MSVVRIGAGAGFSGDRIAPAIDLAERGNLDYLVFECLAERTIALAQKAKLANPDAGFDPLLEKRMRAVLPIIARTGTKIVTNMGAANPQAAARLVHSIATELGLKGLKIAAVKGDDVADEVEDFQLSEISRSVKDLGAQLVSANAYIGAVPIVAALDQGANVVICGRASDPALFLAPLVHHFGWALEDWNRLGRGTLVGHLLECAAQVTGGYFADPGVKDVSDLPNLGFPLAEVSEDGNAIITKLPGTGGQVSRATCTEQLLYEIHDPSEYLQPDVIADFSKVTFEEVGEDRVAVSGGAGRAPTGKLKVSVGYLDGWLAEGQISYAGANCLARARLAAEILGHRIGEQYDEVVEEYRHDFIGQNAISGCVSSVDEGQSAPETRLRFVARCRDQQTAEAVIAEVESLYLCGPAGGGGISGSVRQVVAIASTLLPSDRIRPEVELTEV